VVDQSGQEATRVVFRQFLAGSGSVLDRRVLRGRERHGQRGRSQRQDQGRQTGDVAVRDEAPGVHCQDRTEDQEPARHRGEGHNWIRGSQRHHDQARIHS